MKFFTKVRLAWSGLLAGVVVFGTLLAIGQSAPVLTIAPVPGTNQFQISITNSASSGVSYELWSTPALQDPYYPWTLNNIGSPGQTNFIVSANGYVAQFYRVRVADTNGIPDWELADPNNPALGPLSITIDSPLNGQVLQ